MTKDDLVCPRCGAIARLTVTDEVVCPNSDVCGAVWPSKKNFDHEVVARDLGGTKSKRYGKEYLEDGAEGIKGDMRELVSLVSFMTLQNVYEAVDTSIKGREHMVGQGSPYSEKNKSLESEIEALSGMRDWIKNEMGFYGEVEDDDPF